MPRCAHSLGAQSTLTAICVEIGFPNLGIQENSHHMSQLPDALRSLARRTLKSALRRIHSRFTDPIRLYSIDGLPLFAHEHELITKTFPSYKGRSDTDRYSDPFFVRELYDQWGTCNLIDIGVNYGQDLLLQAAYKERSGIPGEIIGFEPNSRVFSLLVHTFRHNHIAATFHHAALGESPGSIILEGRKHNSQGMTTVGLSFPNIYEVVEVKTLDDALDPLMEQPCFMKLDTQGAEWLIWKGGNRFSRKRDIVVRTEFTPMGTKGIPGPALLDYYFDLYTIIDAKMNTHVEREDKSAFCNRVASTYPHGYTDLYLIPRESPIVTRL